MSRQHSHFVCQSCGSITAKWAGRCDGCGSWNTLVEETDEPSPFKTKTGEGKKKNAPLSFVSLQSTSPPVQRYATQNKEFDRVLGGGLTPASVILVGGDPGIGKSTLLLQAAALLALQGLKTLYISGEEAIEQVRDRARRLGLGESPVGLAAETSLAPVLEGLRREKPDLVILDSIQTLWTDALGAAPGTVTQVRACVHELVRFAKTRGCAVLLVGHVTKDGQIAGPRVVEHMADTVLSFEGDKAHQFRLLRSVKNRFGPADEIGVFEMTGQGLREVPNPSALFLDGRGERASGASVFAGLEGSRPVLTEIQALAAPAAFGTPRRAVVGWDSNRLAMILAVLEARCGLGFGGHDVYLSVAGGLKISDPAADLAVAAALASSYYNVALPGDCVVFGELALSGDIRPASRAMTRIREAARLGFKQILGPVLSDKEDEKSVTYHGFKRLEAFLHHIEHKT